MRNILGSILVLSLVACGNVDPCDDEFLRAVTGCDKIENNTEGPTVATEEGTTTPTEETTTEGASLVYISLADGETTVTNQDGEEVTEEDTEASECKAEVVADTIDPETGNRIVVVKVEGEDAQLVVVNEEPEEGKMYGYYKNSYNTDPMPLEEGDNKVVIVTVDSDGPKTNSNLAKLWMLGNTDWDNEWENPMKDDYTKNTDSTKSYSKLSFSLSDNSVALLDEKVGEKWFTKNTLDDGTVIYAQSQWYSKSYQKWVKLGSQIVKRNAVSALTFTLEANDETDVNHLVSELSRKICELRSEGDPDTYSDCESL